MGGECSSGTEQFECVVCGSSDHDGKGWIFPYEDSEIVAINADGVKRGIKEHARPICSLNCKDEFTNNDRSVDRDTDA